MMAPDYAHWHGMFEVGERFYQKLIPQAREIAHKADADGKKDQAKAVLGVIDAILQRPEHAWYERELPAKRVPEKPVEPKPMPAK